MRYLVRKLFKISNFSVYKNVRFCSSSGVETKPDQTKADPDKNNTDDIKTNIVVEKFGAVTTLNIDRQKSRNSLNVATLHEISEALDAFEKDEEAKVLVLNGEGGTFCSGFDIDEMSEKGFNTLRDAARRLLKRPLCDKPTIAAVTGFSVAEGFELAVACDLRVIEDTAVMGLLGRRFGVPVSLYGARRLTSLLGLSRALDLIITGRLISGTEANAMGLACKLTSTGTALGESMKLAKSLTKFPQNALIMDKLAAVNSQLNPNSEESMRDEAIMTTLGESMKLAKSLTKFPQNALIMDKLAAVNSQLNPNSEESMRDEAVMTSLLGAAIDDMEEGLKKFKKGIGKHGKFYKLTEVPVKDWELEETYEEVSVDLTKKDENSKPDEKK